jgi:uncharacterized protein DUF3300/endosialidase-like protein
MLATVLLLAISTGAYAQAQPSPPATSGSDVQQTLLQPEELDQLVAPIALYPDPLLSEVLMASAYPLDVVQAERWLKANTNLKGDKLIAAVGKQPWDDSIKSLVATPSVLEMMSEKLDWTQKLGDAVVAQQPDVMDAIQRLRAKAQANNKLSSTKQQKVTTSEVQGKQVIAIAPAEPDTVYVPYYDPGVVYGLWPYPAYPPYYFPPPPYLGYGLIAGGIAFGAGYALGRWSGGYWGGNVNWSGGGNNITINRPGGRPSHPIAGGGNKWQPRVDRRQSAGNRQGTGNRGGRQDLNFRGTGGQQVVKPGGKPGTKPSGKPSGGQAGKVEHRANTGQHGPGKGAAAKPKAPHHAAAAPRHHTGAARAHAAPQARAGGGHAAVHRGGGGRAAGRGGGGAGRGGGRRSDLRLKHDVVLLGRLPDGLGLYRFSYNGSNKAYVGVIAQEVQQFAPAAVTHGRDGYLRVYYDRLGVKFESYDRWIRSGAEISGTHP